MQPVIDLRSIFDTTKLNADHIQYLINQGIELEQLRYQSLRQIQDINRFESSAIISNGESFLCLLRSASLNLDAH
jgi:hypothetical protein